MSLEDSLIVLARQAKSASRDLARMTTAEKNGCLKAMAQALRQRGEKVLAANALDIEEAEKSGMSKAMLDRLRLDPKRMEAMARGLEEVAELPDPVHRVLDERTRPNGLILKKVATPIGVVVIIYESRPNVTSDAAGLCFKAGNATILRGGKEALRSNMAIAELMVEAGCQASPKFPRHAVQLVPTPDREAIRILLSFTQFVDLCIPRGGEGLIRAVTDCSKVPVIKHYKGVCHVYVDREADPRMAEQIVLNAKLQRPSVCNAMETLLVDQSVAKEFLPVIGARMAEKQVELRVDEATRSILSGAVPNAKVKPASEQDWCTEYNDYIMNVRVVDGVAGAIAHINQYGSAHSDSIVTNNESAACRFLDEVDSAAVYWNASTRFTDGGEFGMGAEIGISTDKVGARGPMGLDELTTYKWIGYGNGQVRA